MLRVLELDEGYFFGGAHLFWGTILMVKPVFMGGSPDKSREHFEKCLSFCGKQFLMPYVFYARYYAARTFNEQLFDWLLTTVIETDIDILPSQRLPNAIAKEKARQLLKQKDDMF